MRYILFLTGFMLLVGCEHFPSNPPKVQPEPKMAIVQYDGNDYIPAESSVDGLVADKVNVLFFKVRIKNFKAKALEFFGKAIVEGPPNQQEHSIHFWTDQLPYVPKEDKYQFNFLTFIDPETTYTLIRPKFPTNEYAPFDSTQGMIQDVTITEVWAFGEDGNRFSVALGDSTL